MTTRHRFTRGSTLLVAAGALSFAQTAAAADLVVPAGQSQLAGGELFYDTVTIAGTLSVQAYTTDSTNTGWLHLRAKTIVIEAGGAIDATGAGYPGAEDVGSGLGAGATPPEVVDEPTPAGGGAHVGKGGPGVSTFDCSAYPGADGGIPYDFSDAGPLAMPEESSVDVLGGLGSSGGTGHSGGPHHRAGGAGGGIVILQAATITLAGQVLADGEDAGNFGGTSPGGGAGGTVIIVSSGFTAVGGARVSACGGRGGKADLKDALGGSGGGGRAYLVVGASIPSLVVEVAGGAGTTPCTTLPVGGAGMAELVAAPSCIDADGDQYLSEVCDGSDEADCEDGNPDIHPGAPERCDGIDNNCSGAADDASNEELCPQRGNNVCVDGACVQQDPDGGTDGGTIPAGVPPRVELEGGLCTARPGFRSGTAAALLVAMLLAVGLGLRGRHGRSLED